MKQVFELLVIVAVGGLAIIMGINYAGKSRKAAVSESHEESATSTPTASTPAIAVTDSTPTAEAPATNEEEAPAAPAEPQQPAAPTYEADCYVGGQKVFGLTRMSLDDFEYSQNDGWKFTNIDTTRKTAWFNGPCLIQQE